MTRRAAGRTTRKIFHKIGEVCELTKTEPYVLRYWESEFPFLAPEKNRAGQRIYSDDDIEMVLAIKRLLYEEGYTTAGARRRLEKEIAERGAPAGAVDAGASSAARPGDASLVLPPVAPAAPSDDGVRSTGDVAAALRTALRQLRDDLHALRDDLGRPR